MRVIPKIKSVTVNSGRCNISDLVWNFAPDTDERIISAAKRICDSAAGTAVYVSHGSTDAQSYIIHISQDRIDIASDGAAGAFYALMTLKMLKESTDADVECCFIEDGPDMLYRGFYHDATRGKVPTLDTLKKLADTMAEYKLNSLQLYIEHTYEFKEYDFCLDKLGYLTKEEICELDIYCKDRFIELIPSLASFGHLYHLMSSDKYNHLCELQNYIPDSHYYVEKMKHHTINPLMDESFELITSLIDQHMEAFTSDKFNICCDETFDLGTDVNNDKDKGELYVNFVKKLIEHLQSKGKTVMMWGDIILKHPDRVGEISDKVIFLNWDYGAEPIEANIAAMAGVTQIVCPGTGAWNGFHEVSHTEEKNILTLTSYGKKYGAIGILNTNWGDLGNPSCLGMCMYGLILGGAVGWYTETKADKEFKAFVSEYYYGNSEAMNILDSLSNYHDCSSWLMYNWDNMKPKEDSQEWFKRAMDNCNAMIDYIKSCSFKNDSIKNEFLIAAQGDSFVISWNAHKFGYDIKSEVDFDKWLCEYEKQWLKESKRAELDTLTAYFRDIYAKSYLTK